MSDRDSVPSDIEVALATGETLARAERIDRDAVLVGQWTTTKELRFFWQGDRLIERVPGFRLVAEGGIVVAGPCQAGDRAALSLLKVIS